MNKKDPDSKKSFSSRHDAFPKNPSQDHVRNGHHYPVEADEFNADVEEEGFEDHSGELTDEIDHQILMHRDVHFGGDFTVMLDYYNAEENIGIHPDLDPERIAYLAEVEKEIGQDLAPLILTGPEAETVGKARHAYAQIKEIYEIDEEESSYPRLIADLILSEDEEPLAEIESIVAEGEAIVPELLALLRADELYDPLFPGYGYAPYLAILCLGKIGDPKAIAPIFEVLSKQIIFDEMVVVEGLAEIGAPAMEFLLKIVRSRPLTQDNTDAAFALIGFSYETQVATLCFEQLQDPEVQQMPLLRTYLICNCDPLNKTVYKEQFIAFSEKKDLPNEMRTEMKALIDGWV